MTNLSDAANELFSHSILSDEAAKFILESLAKSIRNGAVKDRGPYGETLNSAPVQDLLHTIIYNELFITNMVEMLNRHMAIRVDPDPYNTRLDNAYRISLVRK